MAIFSRSHSEAEYANYLARHLPEYAIDGGIPEPGKGGDSAIRLRLLDPNLANFGSHRPLIIPTQPNPLIITGDHQGKKRLADIKHFVNKRNKIVALLDTDSVAKERKFVLKRYDLWNNFVVGCLDHESEDHTYQHLASLRRDLEKMRDPMKRDRFFLRRFFHSTTPDQKEAMIKKFLKDHGDYYRLDEFKGKNDFWIAPKSPDLAKVVSRIQLHSFSELRQHFGVRSGLSSVFGALVDRIIASEREKVLATEIARLRAVVPEESRIYVQRDLLQRDLATIQHSVTTNHGSTFHNMWKDFKQGIIGKHVRTHPWRRYKILTDALVRPIGRVHTILTNRTKPADPIDVAKEIMNDAKAIVERGQPLPAHPVSREELLETNESRHRAAWSTDLGFGKTAMEVDEQGWLRIQSSLESLSMYEQGFKASLSRIGAGYREGQEMVRPSCQDIHDVLHNHAKILFHIHVMRKEFRERHQAFRVMQANIRDARQVLEQSEDLMKQALVDAISAENEAYELIKNIDLKRYNLVSQLKSEGAREDDSVAREVETSSGMDSVDEFIGVSDGGSVD